MAIPKLETDVKIVSKIPNYPGSEGGLSPEAFKEKFDEAPQIIKDFINNVLIAELNSLVDVQALLNNVIDNTLTLPDKAAGAKATGDAGWPRGDRVVGRREQANRRRAEPPANRVHGRRDVPPDLHREDPTAPQAVNRT
jgi:hypothetical protein